MKRITRILITVLMLTAGICHSPQSAKADAFGITDAGLLVQQILQYFQDMDISKLADKNFGELIKDIDDKTRNMKEIVNIFENGQRGFATFNNTVEVGRKLIRLTSTMNTYMKYVGTMGDDFEIERCYDIYRRFKSKSELVLTQMESTLKSMRKMESEDGSNILNLMDKVITQSSASLDIISNECISLIGSEIHNYKMRDQADATNKAHNTIII